MALNHDDDRYDNKTRDGSLSLGLIAALVVLFALFTWIAMPGDEATRVTTERPVPNTLPPVTAPQTPATPSNQP